MLQIFVCGAQGVGKTTLINTFLQRCKYNNGVVKNSKKIVINENTTTRIQEIARRILEQHGITTGIELQQDKNLMWQLQKWIIKKQIQEECQANKSIVIIDRSILDPMVYGLQIFKERFDTTMYEAFMKEGDDALDDDEYCAKFFGWFFPPFVDDDKGISQIIASIERCRKAIFILVSPRPDQISHNEHDPIRYPMVTEELEEYTNIYKKVLKKLRIPF